jgi:hypothetical protein
LVVKVVSWPWRSHFVAQPGREGSFLAALRLTLIFNKLEDKQ